MKDVERLTEINKLRKIASCWLYSENILAMHGPMNVNFREHVREGNIWNKEEEIREI